MLGMYHRERRGRNEGTELRATTEDPFARLKALRRPAVSVATLGDGNRIGIFRGRERRLEELPGMSPDVPEGAERLASILGAAVREQ